MSDDNWMVCTMCRQTVRLNDIGICMHCQGKYDKHNQPDSWDNLHRCMRCGRKLPTTSGKCGVCDDRECDMFNPAFKQKEVDDGERIPHDQQEGPEWED